MPVIVYKLGGSLLDLPDLPERLRRVVRDDVRSLFVVGGGATADLVRQWDRVHGLGEERAHWLSLRALKLNEALLAELLPGTAIVKSREEAASAWRKGDWAILSAYDFVRAEEPGARLPLPHSWEATSDSVAAWVAAIWPADRLVLLKSVAAPEDCGSPAARGRQAEKSHERNRRSGQSKPEAQAKETLPIKPPFTCASDFDACLPGEGDGAHVSYAVDACFSGIARAAPIVEWINLRDAEPVVRRLNVGPRPSPRETAARPPR